MRPRQVSRSLGTVIYGLWNEGPVSPMPRSGRKVTAILAVSLVVLMALITALGAPVSAQETGGAEAEGGVQRTITVAAIDTGCPDGAEPCWDLAAIPVRAGDRVVFEIDLSPSAQPHNMHVLAPIDQKTDTETGTMQTLEFTIPANQKAAIEFVCDVHPTTMVGQLLPPEAMAALTAGGAHEDIPELGVHFLAYWVGVIAFAILFIVYGATFFLFKYNETSHTTDHWDRSGAEGEGKKGLAGMANLLAVVIAVVAIAAIIYIATR